MNDFGFNLPGAQEIDLYDTLLQQKHIIIAGTPGSGKSVLLNGLIYRIFHRCPRNIVGGAAVVLLDQKGVELLRFKESRHTCAHVVDSREVVEALDRTVQFMEDRFHEMAEHGNTLYNGGDLYVVIDEWADLMVSSKKEVVPLIQKIAQKGRAARIHIILSTQCILAKILPTEIKCCFDTVVALRTATRRESNYIIDMPDCYSLPDYGSCYVKTPKFRIPRRFDCIKVVSDDEIMDVIDYWNHPESYKAPMLEAPERIEYTAET